MKFEIELNENEVKALNVLLKKAKKCKTIEELVSRLAIMKAKDFLISMKDEKENSKAKYINDYVTQELKFKYAMDICGNVVCFQPNNVMKELKYQTLVRTNEEGNEERYVAIFCYKRGTKSDTFKFDFIELYNKMFPNVTKDQYYEMQRNVDGKILESQRQWNKERKAKRNAAKR